MFLCIGDWSIADQSPFLLKIACFCFIIHIKNLLVGMPTFANLQPGATLQELIEQLAALSSQLAAWQSEQTAILKQTGLVRFRVAKTIDALVIEPLNAEMLQLFPAANSVNSFVAVLHRPAVAAVSNNLLLPITVDGNTVTVDCSSLAIGEHLLAIA